jgi:hypothetical protein
LADEPRPRRVSENSGPDKASAKRLRKKKPAKRAPAEQAADEVGFRRQRTMLRVRRRPNERAWELVHPRCALERREDLEEVEAMLAAGETEIAVDELRWLLDGCGDFVAAHRLLGEQALADGDVRLARGHFGYAYEIGLSAMPERGLDGPLPYRLPANRAFLESAKGLAWCLGQLGKRRLGRRVIEQLLKCDPTDPLAVKGWPDDWDALAAKEQPADDASR